MLVAFLFAVALGFPAAAGTDRCPELPAGSGLEWLYREGPDFDLCYAQRSGTKEQPFGIYLGYAPSFHAAGRTSAESGMVGGHAVTWFVAEPKEGGLRYGRETLLQLPDASARPPLQAHVWAYAATEQQLSKTLALLRDIKFK